MHVVLSLWLCAEEYCSVIIEPLYDTWNRYFNATPSLFLDQSNVWVVKTTHLELMGQENAQWAGPNKYLKVSIDKWAII